MGFLDLLTVFIMILYHLGYVEARLLLSFALYLFMKGFMFRDDIASIGDFIIGVYLLIMMLKPFFILTLLSSLFLIQKGLYSLKG